MVEREESLSHRITGPSDLSGEENEDPYLESNSVNLEDKLAKNTVFNQSKFGQIF